MKDDVLKNQNWGPKKACTVTFVTQQWLEVQRF
jgi:hypothetical protein